VTGEGGAARAAGAGDPDDTGVARPASGGRASSAPLLGGEPEPTLFALSRPGRRAWQLPTTDVPAVPIEDLVPAEHRRDRPVDLVEVSERDLVGHFTRLSHRQYAVDLGAYPLGSCTMKYNPKVCDTVAALPGLADVHPAAPPAAIQGWLALLHELEQALCAVTGMAAATVQPAAGAAGELTGLLLMQAWHRAQGRPRRRVVIPDSAHGTNPASVTLGGFEVVTVPTAADGGVDVDALRAVLDEDVAGIMLTNPNTLGLFERRIEEVAQAVHDVGGLLYYDGANLNAIVGMVRPGDMGFDIVHLNLHKTFATPHGGGGPGAGPVAVTARLAPLLPGPRPVRLADGRYDWVQDPASIGRVHGWHGNALVLARALAYLLVHGSDGLPKVAQLAVLNARWLARRLADVFDTPFDEPCMHEFVASAASLRRTHGVRAVDVAKGLLDQGFHAPTVAFPLIVDDALMFEPTETESLQTLEALAEACEAVVAAAAAGQLPEAPVRTPVGRVDEARAARRLVATVDDRTTTASGAARAAGGDGVAAAGQGAAAGGTRAAGPADQARRS
jgi:glycine dehydrogenase subunit 2